MKKFLGIALIAALSGMFSAGLMQSMITAYAVQNPIIPPTSGIFTGVQYSQLIGDSLRSIVSGNKGSTAPANVGGVAVDGLEWIDDTTSTWIKKRYINGSWAVEGAYNSTDSTWAGLIGGGTNSIASASTTDLGSLPQANLTINGTTTINNFGSSAPTGIIKFVRFDDALIIAHSSNILVPGAFNLTTAANDRAIVTHLGSGAWEITQYTRASGIPIDVAAVGKPDFTFSSVVPDLHVLGDGRALTRTSYPAYTSKMSRAQNGTRTSGNATIASVSNTSGFGAGMPVEGTGINAGCTIASVVDNTSITLNSSSCVASSGTSTVTVFLTGYGTGGTSSTIGVPDCIGRKFAGRDVPGARKNRLTASYFGSDSAIMAVANGVENRNLTIANIDAFTPTGSINTGSVKINGITALPFGITAPIATGGSNFNYYGPGGASGSSAITHDLGITFGSLGSGIAHAIVDPTIVAECVVRVTP